MAKPLIQVLEQKVSRTWRELQELYPKLKKYNAPKVKINNRMWRTAGLAHCEIHSVEFSSKFFNRYEFEMYREIVPHELIHVADFIINGDDPTNFWHGPMWCKMMQEYGLPPNRFHEYYINKNDPIVRML